LTTKSLDLQGEFDLCGLNPQSSINNHMLKDSLNTNAHYAVDVIHLHINIMHSHTTYTQFHIAKVLAFKFQVPTNIQGCKF